MLSFRLNRVGSEEKLLEPLKSVQSSKRLNKFLGRCRFRNFVLFCSVLSFTLIGVVCLAVEFEGQASKTGEIMPTSPKYERWRREISQSHGINCLCLGCQLNRGRIQRMEEEKRREEERVELEAERRRREDLEQAQRGNDRRNGDEGYVPIFQPPMIPQPRYSYVEGVDVACRRVILDMGWKRATPELVMSELYSMAERFEIVLPGYKGRFNRGMIQQVNRGRIQTDPEIRRYVRTILPECIKSVSIELLQACKAAEGSVIEFACSNAISYADRLKELAAKDDWEGVRAEYRRVKRMVEENRAAFMADRAALSDLPRTWLSGKVAECMDFFIKGGYKCVKLNVKTVKGNVKVMSVGDYVAAYDTQQARKR